MFTIDHFASNGHSLAGWPSPWQNFIFDFVVDDGVLAFCDFHCCFTTVIFVLTRGSSASSPLSSFLVYYDSFPLIIKVLPMVSFTTSIGAGGCLSSFISEDWK